MPLLTEWKSTKPQVVAPFTVSRISTFISTSSATTIPLLKLFPKKNALPPSKPSSCERSRKRRNEPQRFRNRKKQHWWKLLKPETRKLLLNMNANLPCSVSETTADSRKSRKPEKPTLPISPKWKKRNAYSVKSYWKRNANGQNEPTGKRNFPERSWKKPPRQTRKPPRNGKPWKKKKP